MSGDFDDIAPDVMAGAARRAFSSAAVVRDPIRTPDGWTITPPSDVHDADPVRTLIEAGSEAVRAANHDSTQPGFPADLYSRVGQLDDLLRKLDQLSQRLGQEAELLADRPMTHDAGDDPVVVAQSASLALGDVAMNVRTAQAAAARAQSYLSQLGAGDPS